MGIVSDLLGGGGGGSQKSTTEQKYPKFIEDALKQNLSIADTLANRPYNPYGGELISGYTPDQMQAFQGIRDAQGAAQPFYDKAQGVYQSMLEPGFLQGQINSFMNPYTDQVISGTLGDIERQRQLAQNTQNASAVGSGAFGGTRQAIQNAENERNYATLGANTAANLRQQGYTQAANLAQSEAGRQANLANALAGLGTTSQAQRYNDLNALQALGGTLQGADQAQLDLAYKKFLEEQNYPLQQLQLRQNAIAATPIANTTVSNVPVQGSNPLGGILGGAGAGAGLFGSIFPGGSGFTSQGAGAALGGILGLLGG